MYAKLANYFVITNLMKQDCNALPCIPQCSTGINQTIHVSMFDTNRSICSCSRRLFPVATPNTDKPLFILLFTLELQHACNISGWADRELVHLIDISASINNFKIDEEVMCLQKAQTLDLLYRDVPFLFNLVPLRALSYKHNTMYIVGKSGI